MNLIDAYITIKEDVDLKTLEEISNFINVKLGWLPTASRRVEKIFGKLPLPGIVIRGGIMEFKESDVKRLEDLLEQKNLAFEIDVREQKTIYEYKSKK